MDKNGFIAIIFVFLFVSTSCDASLVFHLRKLIASEGNNSSATSQVPPIASSVNGSNTNMSSLNAENSQLDKQKESQKVNQTHSNVTLPVDPKGSNKHDNETKPSGAPIPPAAEGEKNGSRVDGGNGKVNETLPKPDNNDSCDRSISFCKKQGMVTCIKASKEGGSEKMFLVTKNEGEITLKVNVKLPNSLKTNMANFEVLKHTSKRIDISSSVGKSSKLIVSSGSTMCELALAQSVSVDKIIQQLSYYSKQVTPTYAIYASFLVTLLLGGTWACCRFRKRNQQGGVPYQELEMGIPESASAAADGNGSEGWDHDWDDDWDEEIAVKSPSGHQVRSVSADGLTSRSPKKEGWDNDWED
ncbi:hypothetical protein C2S51_008198 [Perilla frutescens var. frutescens]|nr:hypothetical protein C2S51_008198 [Perilla frutescens var. frutescens]